MPQYKAISNKWEGGGGVLVVVGTRTRGQGDGDGGGDVGGGRLAVRAKWLL